MTNNIQSIVQNILEEFEKNENFSNEAERFKQLEFNFSTEDENLISYVEEILNIFLEKLRSGASINETFLHLELINKLFNLLAKFHESETLLSKTSDDFSNLLLTITNQSNETLNQLDQKVRNVTATSLATAFEIPAHKLMVGRRWWIGGVVFSITTIVLSSIVRYIYNIYPNNWLELLTIHLPVAGSIVWFMWLASKQLHQEFRLQQDYEYKAAVSRAYIGFREESARLRLGGNLERELLQSLIARLNEHPLVHLSNNKHETPLQDFLQSEQFQKLIQLFPELKDTAIELIRKTFSLNSDAPSPISKDKPE